MADSFFVTAVLVTHDGATWLPEVIAAIGSQSRPVDRIIAVDTGSVDSSLKLLKSSGISTIPEERDMGYGDAIEHALALTPAAGENEWIWLLHDDCAPDRQALQLMLAALEDRPQVAIAGPKLRGWYDRDQLLEMGISIAGDGARWTGLEDGEQDQGQYDVVTEVMSVSTAAMLVRRNVFEELGGLDINLALFRDDVDFGWRVHVAGHKAICVGQALAFHVEASANERRAVDVSEAFLHRPLLLDRRNAAYVLLVNSSWWMLPWIALQLFITSLIRALTNLLAKLPGYAGDEVAAVGLLLAHPAELFQARRDRKKKRLLSPRIISHFIPSTWSQIRLGFERAGSVISDLIIPERRSLESVSGTPSYSDIGTVDENFDDADLTPPVVPSIWKGLLRKPQFLIAFAIALISLFATRGRFGSLSGGALAHSPSSGFDLLHRYAESWHLVGLGSAVSMSPWLPLLGISSLITFGNLQLLITLIFLFAPAVSFLTIYRVLLHQGVRRNYGLIGAGIYVASPLLWASINQGRIGTILLLQLLPILLTLSPFSLDRDTSTWRRTFAIALLAGVIGAFSPLLLIVWTLIQTGFFVQRLVEERHHFQEMGWSAFLISDRLDKAKRRLALTLTPWLLTFPWSASLIIHPTQIFLEPGIPLAAGSRLDVALFNPGGVSAPPLWILSPFITFLLLTVLVTRLRNIAVVASAALATALLISQYRIPGHGSFSQVWTGPLIAVAMVVLLAPSLLYLQEFLPRLSERRFGARHIGLALLSLICILNLLVMPFWAATGGANSLVHANASTRIPAFLTALEQTPSRPKAMVISSTGVQTTYFVTRGSDIYLGDADVSIGVPVEISQAMTELVGGGGVTASRTLGLYGIQYLYLENPAPISLVRTIDGIGGFTRMSATSSGIVWRVVGSSPRVLFVDASGKSSTLKSNDVGALDRVSSAGTIQVAEKFDAGWKLLLDGRPVPVQRSVNGLPYFTIPQAGEITLSYDGTLHRALISIQLITLIFVIVMALPAGRKRRDLPLDELS